MPPLALKQNMSLNPIRVRLLNAKLKLINRNLVRASSRNLNSVKVGAVFELSRAVIIN
jgi:hypothetical protein